MVMQVLPIQGMFIVVSVIKGCTYDGKECRFKKWSIPRSQRRKMSFCLQRKSGRGKRQKRQPAPGRRPPWGPTPCSQQSESGKPVRLLLMTASPCEHSYFVTCNWKAYCIVYIFKILKSFCVMSKTIMNKNSELLSIWTRLVFEIFLLQRFSFEWENF